MGTDAKQERGIGGGGRAWELELSEDESFPPADEQDVDEPGEYMNISDHLKHMRVSGKQHLANFPPAKPEAAGPSIGTFPEASDEYSLEPTETFDEPRAYPLEPRRKPVAKAPYRPQAKPQKRHFGVGVDLRPTADLTFEQVNGKTLDDGEDDLSFSPDSLQFDNPPRRKKPPPLRVDIGNKPRTESMMMVEEIEFIFDGTFHINGFQISQGGIQEIPGNLSRAHNVDMYEDVPSSKRTFVVVKSFGELEFIDGRLGNGSSGYVRLARHKKSNTFLAVKVVDVQKRGNRDQIDKELRTLMGHSNPFVVRFFQAFYNGAGAVHMVLEYMDCGSLGEAIKESGACSEGVTRVIALHCLRGLKYLHENQILHRDLKSANILLSASSKRAKLSDFGIAKQLTQSEEDRTKTFVGTLDYMSPERLIGQDYTYASDIWSLGITLAECLIGGHPTNGDTGLNQYMEEKSIRLDAQRFSANACSFISICTQVQPELRPSAEQLLRHPWVCGGIDMCKNEFGEWLKRLRTKREQKLTFGRV